MNPKTRLQGFGHGLRAFRAKAWLAISLTSATCTPSTRSVTPQPSSPTLVRFAPPWTSVFRQDPRAPYHLRNEEGQHLFILGKTAWHYFSAHDPQVVLGRARKLGANVIRVALEGNLYFAELGIDAWPWKGTRAEPNFEAFNEAYWKQVEDRIAMAGAAGIGIDLVLYASLHLTEDSVPSQCAYWNRVLQRLGRYANILTWEIQNEYVGNERFQDEVASHFVKHDQHRRPIITSNGTRDVPTWPQKPWMGMAITHTCTGSTARHPLDSWYLAVARNARSFGLPSFNNETGRENRHSNDDGVHRRKQAWLWSAAGGFWTWHSWDGCEGINDVNYKAPGEEFMLPMTTFFSGTAFWRLQPEHVALQIAGEGLVHASLADTDRAYLMTYLASTTSGAPLADLQMRYRLPNGQYHVTFRDPKDGDIVAETDVETHGMGAVGVLPLPSFHDDLVIEWRRIKAAALTEMPHTQ